MARVRFLDQVPVGFYDTNNGGGGTGAGFPYSGSAVITGSLLISGSGLTVTGSINADNITGSLFGTASWARNALTASYALNGGVTQITAGGGVVVVPSSGVGNVTINATAASYNTATGSYGSFYDTGSYLATSATTIYSMSLSTTDTSQGVYVSGSDRTRIYFSNTGVYNVQFSAQFSNSDNEGVDVAIWLRKNDASSLNDISDSTGICTVPPSKAGQNGQTISGWNYYVSVNSGDFIQLLWHPTVANKVTLQTIAAGTNPTHPRTPSLILTAQRVDTFLSNTGSFSGSFTGNLLGTASYALSAKPAGLDTEIQFNSASVFSSSPYFTYNSSTDSLQQGSGTITLGLYSHAEGAETQAIGDGSHAEGTGTQASGSYSHAEGFGTIAIGDGSHAEGRSTQASGSYSHAEGFNTIASGPYQHVQGQFNIPLSAQSAFIIGNGTSDINRSNLVVASGSQVQILGSLIVNGSITGSLFGTASSAITSQTASFLPVGTYAITASWAQSAITSQTASFISTSSTNAFVQGGNSFGVATAMLGNNDNNSLAIETSGSTRIFIDKGGNIGIGSGNTTPTQTLYIQGSSAESGNVFAVANSIPTTLFTIQNAGNVGIGTNNPGVRLDVSGSTRTTTLSITGSNTDTLLRIDSPASSSILFVSGSGNVGIGTNNPTSSLHIVGTTTAQSIVPTAHNTYDIGTTLTRFRNMYLQQAITAGSGYFSFLYFLTTDLRIFNSTSPVTQVGKWFGNGNLLIGSSTIDNGYRLQVIDSGSASGSVFISGSASQPLLIASSSAGTALFVSGSGRVGVGVNNPNANLHTTGTFSLGTGGDSLGQTGAFQYIGSNIFYFNNIAGTRGFQIFTNTGTINGAIAGGILSARGGSGIILMGDNVRTTYNDLIIASGSGYIGIGTSTPSASLHISGGNMILEGSMSFSDPTKTINGLVGNTFTIKSTNNSIDIQAGSSNTIRVHSVAGRLLLIPTTYGSFPTDNTYRTQIYSNTPDTGALYISSSNVAINVDTPGNTNLLYISGSQVSVGSNIQTGARFYVLGNTLTNGNVSINGASTTTGNAFVVRNNGASPIFTIANVGQISITSPNTMSIDASQSAFSINHQISASNVVGGQYYGINYTPTFWQTAASQTETAFRIAATFTQSSAAATSGSNIIADFGAVNVGSQLTVTDVTSGSIYMVNDVSGLPIIEATSDWSVNMYNYPNIVFRKTGSSILITGSLNVTGSLNMSPTSSFVLPLTSSASPQTGSAFWSGSFLYVYDGTRYRSSSFA